ncbi:MAG: hypothetical protein ABI921_00620 [Panacibacter sp.]
MLHIKLELPSGFDFELLQPKQNDIDITLEEMPGTHPRIIIAYGHNALDFYKLGIYIASLVLIKAAEKYVGTGK